MATIQAKLLTVKDKVFNHNNRKERPTYFMESKYDKGFIYTESSLFQTYNNFELLKAFTQKKNTDFIEENPINEEGKKRRKLKNNVELLTELVISYDTEIFEAVDNPQKIHQDSEKLAVDFLVKELGFQVLCVATHLDEHHKDKKDKRNYHTHITLLNYNFKTHKTVKRTLSKKHLVSVQDMVSKQYEKYGFIRRTRNDDELSHTLDTRDENKIDTAKIVELQNEIAQRNNFIKSLQEKLLIQTKEISNLKSNPIKDESNTAKLVNLEEEIKQRNDFIKSLQEKLLMQSDEIERLKNRPTPKLEFDNTKIEELEKKNQSLSTLIRIILEELNVSKDDISNMNFHAIDDMKELVYKKLDLLKLYEFLNVGFAPTEEEVHLNNLEERFTGKPNKPSSNDTQVTINITTDDF